MDEERISGEELPNTSDDLFRGGQPISEALEKLRLRLLDLTARNRLLNFRHSAAKTLPFVEGHSPAIYDKLIESNERRVALLAIPEPKRTEWVERQGRLARPDVRDYASSLGINTSFELVAPERGDRERSSLRALLYPEELERHCRKLAREAKTAIEETGANMLFLLLGFLEYPEAPGAGKTLIAPLVPIPVALEKGEVERGTGTYRYSVVYTGEELAENLSLREKLRGDFSLELPVFTEEASLESYYREVRRAIEGKPGFKLKQQATLALVSMTKMLLVRDLDPKNWPMVGQESALTKHEIVRMVFEGRQHEGDGWGDDDYDIDQHRLAELPLIFDADSSQHSALIDAVEQKNLVIEGPPGTGKSQTITNLIASAIASGKKVLFVAEKLAALQVVKSRLMQAGLADFCLELHSNKSSKKDVLEAIETRAGRRYATPPGLDAQLGALREKTKALAAYVDLVNSRMGNAQGLTVHDVLWKAERYRQKLGDAWRATQNVKVERASALTQPEFDSLHDQLSHLAKEHERIQSFGPSAPFWGFFPTSLAPAGELEIERALTDALPAIQALSDAYVAAANVLDGEALRVSKEETKGLAALLTGLASKAQTNMTEALLPRLFSDSDPRGLVSESVLKRLEAQLSRARELREQFDGRVHSDLCVTAEMRSEAEAIVATLKNLGLDGWSAANLDGFVAQVHTCVKSARESLNDLRVLAEVSGIEFRPTDRCVASISIPIELARSCPREQLHRRRPELAAPDAVAVVVDAQRRFAAIAKRETELAALFYLDMDIAEGEVERAVSALRQGAEWWRLFQKRYRQALYVHKRFAKKKKMTRGQRTEELELLYAHLKERRLAKEDVRYRRAMGAEWNANATDFRALRAIAEWIAKANSTLLEAGLSSETFSPLEATPSQIVALSHSEERRKRATTALDACAQLFTQGALMHATATKKAFVAARDWTERSSLLITLAERLGAHARALKSLGFSSLAAGELLRALTACDAHRHLLEEVSGDGEAKGLLGTSHQNLDTDLEPVWRAHEYGRAVLELALPEQIERVLLSETGNALRMTLLARLADIERAWLPVENFCDFLGARGRFELEDWAGANPSAPEFADGLASRTKQAIDGVGGLLHWVQYVEASQFARERGLVDFVDLLETEEVAREHIASAFGYRFYGSIAEELFATNRALGSFSGLSHDAIRNEFRKLDKETIRLRGRQVAAEAVSHAHPPAGTSGARVADKTELALLEYLMPQSRPRMPIRRMLRAAGRSIQAYKPCFMMGPQAVAQYLEPGAVQFDIVVMDEASQLRPEEALGAIARGKQLVVVGDPKQLPPTAFFDRLGETQDDDAKAQTAMMLESILDVCMGHFRPVRTLRWHYRSRHESLIAFSNARFYRNNLIVFPSPYERGRNLGVKLRYIEGATYDSQMNVSEANVVVEAVLAHMRDRPDDSLGVVTLNLKQRELIEELLDKKMRHLDYAEAFAKKWGDDGFGFFVKNLENVQGDERDVIFVSTTFGPAPGTRVVYQRFGPISRHDGWRRLNVLFTRARKSLTVFTSMRPEDIVDDETVPRGTRELRAYLDYARNGRLTHIDGQQGDVESDFEAAVMDALAAHGYECTPQLGVAGFRIDLAVRHPRFANSYLAAVECDGAAYHSGRSARDRDRIRQEILEELGWRGRIYRIWSTDWYRAPGVELARLIMWLGKLKDAPMDEAYLVLPEPEVVVPATAPGQDSAAAGVEQLSLDSLGLTVDEEDEPLEIQVGDRVTYATTSDGRETSVTIGLHTDQANGEIAYTTPLADALLGFQEGEIATLKQPGRPAMRLRVVRIERSVKEMQ